MLNLISDQTEATSCDPGAVESVAAAAPTITPLRNALRALASKPDFYRAPHEAIVRLRSQVDTERCRLALDLETSSSSEERLRNWTRLADGAVIGLSHLARLCVDGAARSAIAPFALMAVGKYGARCCDPETSLELHCLLPEDEESRERSGRIFAFIRVGLAELNLQGGQDTLGTALESARMAQGDPVAAARFATTRFLSGQFGLYVGFAEILARRGWLRTFDVDASQPDGDRPSTGTSAAPHRPAFQDRDNVGCEFIL